ncbi:hypothetical protein Tco_1516547 [Tanacetum coccineum]
MELLSALLHSPSTQLESYFTRSTNSLLGGETLHNVAYTLTASIDEYDEIFNLVDIHIDMLVVDGMERSLRLAWWLIIGAKKIYFTGFAGAIKKGTDKQKQGTGPTVNAI